MKKKNRYAPWAMMMPCSSHAVGFLLEKIWLAASSNFYLHIMHKMTSTNAATVWIIPPVCTFFRDRMWCGNSTFSNQPFPSLYSHLCLYKLQRKLYGRLVYFMYMSAFIIFLLNRKYVSTSYFYSREYGDWYDVR